MGDIGLARLSKASTDPRRVWVSYTPSPHGVQHNVGLYGVPITL
jgi:hypothetical protein